MRACRCAAKEAPTSISIESRHGRSGGFHIGGTFFRLTWTFQSIRCRLTATEARPRHIVCAHPANANVIEATWTSSPCLEIYCRASGEKLGRTAGLQKPAVYTSATAAIAISIWLL